MGSTALAQLAPGVAPPAPPPRDWPKRILVLGDSVTWGQGLRENEKMHNVLAKRIFLATGQAPYVASYAHSGAVIGANEKPQFQELWWPREIPSPDTSILNQIDAATQNEIDPSFDLIVVDGGLNDVDVRFVFNPTTTPAQVRSAAMQRCGPDMTTLLAKIRARFLVAGTATRVFVLTYYPILSHQSVLPDPLQVATVLARETLHPAPFPPAAHHGAALTAQQAVSLGDKLIDNALAFREASLAAHTQAVAGANAVDGGSRFVLVDPHIDESEAAFTKKPLIWGMSGGEPQDPLVLDRTVYCEYELKPQMKTPLDTFLCLRASVGHPNIAGAQRYADAMFALLAPAGAPPVPAS